MAEDLRRTVHAQKVFEFGDLFNLKFQIITFGDSPKRRWKLNEAEVSTDGGRKARQPIMLTSVDDDAAIRPIVGGWIDTLRRVAEARSYAVVRQQLEGRSQKLDLSREEYERAIEELRGFLRIHQIELTIVEGTSAPAPAREERPGPRPAPRPQAAPAPGAGVGPLLLMLFIGVLIGFGLGYLVFGLRVLGASG